MPNLEPRYIPQDGALMDAWIFGMVDAIEFIQLGHKANNGKYGWYELTMDKLITDVANYAEENWKDEFNKFTKPSAVPVSEGSSGPDSTEEALPTRRSTRARENARSAELSGGDGSVQPDGLARSIDSHPSSQRKNRLDQIDRAVRTTEIPTDGCGGSGHWFINEEGHLIGVCSCLVRYGTDNSGSQPRRGRHAKESA